MIILIVLQNFNSNPYFKNTKLSKTYTFLEDGPTKITASTIQWTEGRVSCQFSIKRCTSFLSLTILFYLCRTFLMELLMRRKETSDPLLRKGRFLNV